MHISIRIKGHLDQDWQPWLEGLQIGHEPDGTTLLTGLIKDQPALYGLLIKLNHLSLSLLFLQSSELMEHDPSFEKETSIPGQNGDIQTSEAVSRSTRTNRAKGAFLLTTNPNQRGRYASINGLDLYYEIHGAGQPLVVLPGAFYTIEMMGEIVPQLATQRQVIAVELQGHGHTADIERPLHFELLADDIAALIRHLDLGQADLFGFSLGGGVGLQTAIRHPEVVRTVALVSTPLKRDGWYPEDLATMAAMSAEALDITPIHEAYVKTSPRPEAWPTVVDKVRQLVTSDYDWTEAIAGLKMPILILVGDADGVRLAHAVEFFGLLGGGKADGDLAGLPAAQLAVLPATTHVGWAPPYHGILTRSYLLPILSEFFGTPLPEGR